MNILASPITLIVQLPSGVIGRALDWLTRYRPNKMSCDKAKYLSVHQVRSPYWGPQSVSSLFSLHTTPDSRMISESVILHHFYADDSEFFASRNCAATPWTVQLCREEQIALFILGLSSVKTNVTKSARNLGVICD